MQTFLTNLDFGIAARQLDSQRLGKQRVECYQILRALTDLNYGWQNHPAVKMWRRYEYALARYGLAICDEWVNRGYKDSCFQKIVDLFDGLVRYQGNPPWLTEEFCSNHRAILLGKAWQVYEQLSDQLTQFRATGKKYDKIERKMYKAANVYDWYRQFGWTEQPAEQIKRDGRLVWPYLWPKEG